MGVFILLGAQSVLTYATVNGLLVGWDLRSPKNAWQLKNDPKHGKVHSELWVTCFKCYRGMICIDKIQKLQVNVLCHA